MQGRFNDPQDAPFAARVDDDPLLAGAAVRGGLGGEFLVGVVDFDLLFQDVGQARRFDHVDIGAVRPHDFHFRVAPPCGRGHAFKQRVGAVQVDCALAHRADDAAVLGHAHGRVGNPQGDLSAGDAAVHLDRAPVGGDDIAGKRDPMGAQVVNLFAQGERLFRLVVLQRQMPEGAEKLVDRVGFRFPAAAAEGQQRGQRRWSAEDFRIAPAVVEAFGVVFPDQHQTRMRRQHRVRFFKPRFHFREALRPVQGLVPGGGGDAHRKQDGGDGDGHGAARADQQGIEGAEAVRPVGAGLGLLGRKLLRGGGRQ